MPCSFAASATALNQDRCRCFSVVILFIRCIFGKLHVFHRSLDQILVFIVRQSLHSSTPRFSTTGVGEILRLILYRKN